MERLFWACLAGMVVSFGRHSPRKQIKKSDLIIQSSDRYTAPTAQYGYGIPNFSFFNPFGKGF
jgi:hypothetical protein